MVNVIDRRRKPTFVESFEACRWDVSDPDMAMIKEALEVFVLDRSCWSDPPVEMIGRATVLIGQIVALSL